MSAMRLLRHNTCHHLYFPGDGKLPQLNPISSSSHTASGKRTKSWHEPLWSFRLRQRLFAFAGRQRCPDRAQNPVASRRFNHDEPLPDTWDVGPDGNRTCSFCGSVHPDDLMEICRKTIVDERYGVEGTTKSYKVYVRSPGVRNAAEGAIKFYTWHAPEQPTKADQELFAAATKVTNERFRASFSKVAAQ
jgi:hypothetical protein